MADPHHHPAWPPRRLAAVAIGGAAGTLARAVLAEGVGERAGWPVATLVANLAGCALLAVLVLRWPGLMRPGGSARSLLGVGLCGGLTTFSLLQVEIVALLRDGRPGLAAGYGAASLLGGLAAVFAVRPRRGAA